MPGNNLLIVTADKLSVAILQGEVVAIFDLSAAQVYPKELGLRLLPAEARAFARQLEQLAGEAESALPRA